MVEVRAGAGRDVLAVRGGEGTIDAGSEDDLITVNGSGYRIDAQDGDDTITIEGDSSRDVNGGNGDDTIEVNGSQGASTIRGNDGDDTITVAGEGSRVNGGRGNDNITVGELEDDPLRTINGGSGDDTIEVEKSNNGIINGEAGNDKIRVLGANRGSIDCGDGEDMSLDAGAGCEQVLDEIPYRASGNRASLRTPGRPGVVALAGFGVETSGMSPDEKVAVLRKIFAEFAASGSVDGLLGVLTEDVVYRVTVAAGTPLSGEFVGVEGVKRYFEVMPTAVEHLGFNVYDFLADEETAVVTGDERLRVVRNGEVFESDWAVVCKWRGDRIRSVLVIENLGPLSAAYVG